MLFLAVLMEACQMAGVREPLAFYDLSELAQEMWLAHAKNKVSGAYFHGPSKVERKEDWKQAAIDAARSRGALPVPGSD